MSTTCPAPFPTDGQRPISHEAAMQRMQALSHQMPAKLEVSCESRIQVGISFDGTGNNMKLDFEDPPPEKRKHTHGVKLFKQWAQRLFLWLSLGGLLALSACEIKPPTWAVSYGAVNHSDKSIVAIAINGEGGILTAPMHGQGGGVCCVIVPQRWSSGLNVTVKWREAGTYKRDAQGNEVLESGVPVLIETPWKTQTVPLPKYEGEGRLFVFFFPGDVVKVALTSSPVWDEWYAPTEEDLAYEAAEAARERAQQKDKTR